MKQLLLILLSMTLLVVGFGQNRKLVRGHVQDEAGKPIAFASVKWVEGKNAAFTDAAGNFELLLNAKADNVEAIELSYVGKQSVTLQANTNGELVTVVLKELNLKLKDVEVAAKRKGTESNSSVLFNRQAIEQVQATSMSDVLRYLPGQTIAAPDLQNSKNIVLRNVFNTNLSGNNAFKQNSAFGTSIVLDGSTVSNNANMQALNPAKQGGGAVSSVGNARYANDVAGAGIDLRSIPADNIESIEVVAGVASAKYGDMTDGAIIVNRQAGKTPYIFSARFREGTSNFHLDKGLSLGKKGGNINIGFDYLLATADPRDNVKTYNRIGANLIWTTFIGTGARWKNTLSLDYGTTLDGARVDPDDAAKSRIYFNSTNLAISTRGEIKLQKTWSRSINYNFRYNLQTQESYKEFLQQSLPTLAVSDKRTSGLFEGEWVPGIYTYSESIKGRPSSFFGRLENDWDLSIGKMVHQMALGVSLAGDANNGDGFQYDYRRPPASIAQSGRSDFSVDRPYTYAERVPAVLNLGVYLEDHFKFKLFKKLFDVRAGLRFDNMNGISTLSPRVNTWYGFANGFKFNMSYGISTKAPALIHRYPAPIYYEYPLLKFFNSFNSKPDSSLYLLMMNVATTENRNLKPQQSQSWELGLSYNKGGWDLGLTYFSKKNTDGFTQQNRLVPAVVPVYDTLPRATADNKFRYYNTGRDTVYRSDFNEMVNGNTSRTSGIELVLNTPKIDVIQTSFNINTAWYSTEYFNAALEVDEPNRLFLNKTALYGVYENSRGSSELLKSTILSNTHIANLGLVVTFTSELFWYNWQLENNANTKYPVGYYDKNLNYFPISDADKTNADYAHLVNILSDQTKVTDAFYANFHLRISKEIGKNIRLSFNAINVFDIRPVRSVQTGTSQGQPVFTFRTYNGLPSYGAEVVVKF
jgi:ferric enterobactin receptor